MIAVLAVTGCGSDSAAPPLSLVEQGWAAFEAGDFAKAEDLFAQAIAQDSSNAEGYNGIGWSQMKRGKYTQALASLDEAVMRGHSGADPHAGRAILLRDIEPVDYDAAIFAVLDAIAADATWTFEHDTSVNWRDLRLISAQSHFALGDYTVANSEVGALGGNMQDPLSPTFVQDLFTEIERLGNLYIG